MRSPGRILSASIHSVNFHGTHHRFGKLACGELQLATERARQLELQPVPIYRSYFQAVQDMLPKLANPRIGPQWLEEPASSERPAGGRISRARQNETGVYL